ncbi:MAG: hypothetical protein M5U18_02475 [Dehalococcoidia bacterium]|nr:hypothetical protein [Dehalococcoidia bacterium]
MNHTRTWTIDVAADDPERMRAVVIRAIDSDGRPVAGATIDGRIEGHGTFDSTLAVTLLGKATAAEGHVYFEWWEFPRYNPRRALHSEVTFSCDDPKVFSISGRLFLSVDT